MTVEADAPGLGRVCGEGQSSRLSTAARVALGGWAEVQARRRDGSKRGGAATESAVALWRGDDCRRGGATVAGAAGRQWQTRYQDEAKRGGGTTTADASTLQQYKTKFSFQNRNHLGCHEVGRADGNTADMSGGVAVDKASVCGHCHARRGGPEHDYDCCRSSDLGHCVGWPSLLLSRWP